jgi:competence protein ComEA
MKNRLIEAFNFSKREYNGMLALVILMVAVSLAPYVYECFLASSNSTPIGSEKAALQQLALVDRYRQKSFRNYTMVHKGMAKPAAHYFKFNPNLITEKEWQQFGLSYKQAISIVNYVKKGGKFRKADDLKKMYTISPEKYEVLLPYVVIPQSDDFTSKERFVPAKKELTIVDLNTADTLELDKIKGVGPAFARRIVNYRHRLGGFYRKEQLLEVFGVDTPKFLEIKDQVKINVAALRQININTAEFADLKQHPYLSFKQMNAIINYRKQHGPYHSIADLNKVLILKPETVQKLAPYLTF